MNANIRETNRRRNPEETSNFLSRLFFGWTVLIVWKGSRSNLKATDIYATLKCNESAFLGDRLEREWKKDSQEASEDSASNKNGKGQRTTRPNLVWAIVRIFWAPYMAQGLLLLVQLSALRVLHPVLQGWVIGHFNPGRTQTTRSQVLLTAGLLIITLFVSVLITYHANLRNQEIGMRVRVACCSLIYRKVLRLDEAALSNSAAGQAANLISNDVARFDLVLMYLHYTWIMPIQMLVAGYAMWDSVGIITLVGIGAMISQTIPVLVYFNSLTTRLRAKIAVETDKRIQLITELVAGIQVLKMYSWEKPFKSMVSRVRKVEIKLISSMSHLRGFCASMMIFTDKVSLYLTLVTFVLAGNQLTPEATFVIFSLINLLKQTCSIFFPQSMILSAEAIVSFDRITDFLLLDEVKFTTYSGLQAATETTAARKVDGMVGIELVRVAANWVHGQLPATLCGISFEVKSRSLCAIVGPVGSGKSSLLHLMLNELEVVGGTLKLFFGDESRTRTTSRDIRISYTSQDPWLFTASIRDNILFDQTYDEMRYLEVTRVCALLRDFEQLPQGDLTFVGERGVSLSGGQRARINLARAIYREADLYLLDDPLSAVDARVGRHLFEECITGFLNGKTRVLVTHQLRYLREADTVVVLNRGTVECHGTYDEVVKSNLDFLESESCGESGELEGSDEESVGCKDTASTAVGDNAQPKVADAIDSSGNIKSEATAIGELSSKVYWGYFSSGGNICTLAFLLAAFIAGQIASNGTDCWIAYWTNQEALRVAAQLKEFATDEKRYQNETDSNHQGVRSQWFDEYGLMLSEPAIYVYTAFILGGIILAILSSMLFMRVAMNASRKLHNSMLANLLSATMRFFEANPSGRVLNRFSNDMGIVDEQLPRSALDTVLTFTTAIGRLLMVVVVNNWMILPGVVISGILHFVRKFYINTLQEVQRYEKIMKSPVLSHINATLNGLSTIRSRGAPAEALLRREFDHLQDAHTGAWYLSIGIVAAFGLFVDLLSCSFIACVCFSLILLDDGDTLPGNVGFAISQSMLLISVISHMARQSANLNAQMTCVERILQYTELPREGPITSAKPPAPTWPRKGGLIFKNVAMRYAEDKPPVLKGLNLEIKPGWKVGIVGRTGAGKSSLISALFRLTGDGIEGEIVLDGIDTKSIGLHELRPRISIIPQEPVLFSASLRYNLDPFERYSDAELWDSLREVELGDVVPSLDSQVAGGGANFSVGQRQLICLARAILRNNRLLVLDEATANVDHATDALIQNTIRRRFADCTVLTIAHRLNTVMDSDRVLVMRDGCIVEFGHPHLLLKDRRSHFSQMLQQTGKTMAAKLAGIAEDAYPLRPEFRHKSNILTDTTDTSEQCTQL